MTNPKPNKPSKERVKEFQEFVDDMFGKHTKGMIDKIVYPLTYQEYSTKRAVVLSMVYDKFLESKWFQEHNDEIVNIISFSIVCQMYIDEINKKKQKEVSRLKGNYAK